MQCFKIKARNCLGHNKNHLFKILWVFGGEPIKIEDLQSLYSPLLFQISLFNPRESFWDETPKHERRSMTVISPKMGTVQNDASGLKTAIQLLKNSIGKDSLQLRIDRIYSGDILNTPNKTNIYNPLTNQLFFLKNEFDLHNYIKFSHNYFRDSFSPPISITTISIQDQKSFFRDIYNRKLGLSASEIEKIYSQYNNKLFREIRLGIGLPESPTDLEVEMIAQTWSEHCKHKIFNAHITHFSETEKMSTTIDSLFQTYIKGATDQIINVLGYPYARSLFKDNAGVVSYQNDGIEICLKVETHNTPSVLHPYGGAITGILGVNRDVMGTGKGFYPIANMNALIMGEIYCQELQLPQKVFHPKDILLQVHQGLVDGGNKMGIPTISGAMSFHGEFNFRPLIYCGSIGIGQSGDSFKEINNQDLIVMVGGLVGRDGLHGATCSSQSIDNFTSSNIVQIGDPYTQKKLLDFLSQAKERELYNFITDCGAGGLSSAVGEMALEANGAVVHLDWVGTKVESLAPWEIMLSESQERMVLAVPRKNIGRLTELAQEHEIDCSVIGEFNQSGFIKVYYQKEPVANLDLEFLHHGYPGLQLKSRWHPSALAHLYKPCSFLKSKDISSKIPLPLEKKLLLVLSHPNLANKDKLTSQFDQEVQGASFLNPYKGYQAGIIDLTKHHEDSQDFLVVSHGLSNQLSLFEPKISAMRALDEAIRNLIIHGTEIGSIALTDNFCMPDPVHSTENTDGEFKLGALVEMCQGIFEIAKGYGTPFISGKDSMKNDFIQDGIKESIAPHLFITGIGKISKKSPPPVNLFIEKNIPVSTICLKVIKGPDFSYLGSLAHQIFSTTQTQSGYSELNLICPDYEINYKIYQKYNMAFNQSLILAAQDLGEGGIWSALTELCLANNLGAHIQDSFFQHLSQNGIERNISEESIFRDLCSEGTGGILIAIESSRVKEFENIFSDLNISHLGHLKNTHNISFSGYKIELRDCLKNSGDFL